MNTETANLLMQAGISVKDPAAGIAARIHSAKELKEFLLLTPLAQRKKAYEALRPHLKFPVLNYSLLFGAQRTRRRQIH